MDIVIESFHLKHTTKDGCAIGKPNHDVNRSLELIGSLLQHLDENYKKMQQNLEGEIKKLKHNLEEQIKQLPHIDKIQLNQRRNQEEEQLKEWSKLEEELKNQIQQLDEEHLEQRLNQEKEHKRERERSVEEQLEQRHHLEKILLKERQDLEEKQRNLRQNRRWQELLKNNMRDSPLQDDAQTKEWTLRDGKQYKQMEQLEENHNNQRECLQEKHELEQKKIEEEQQVQHQQLLEKQAIERAQLEEEQLEQWKILEEKFERERQKLQDDQCRERLHLKEDHQKQRQQLEDIVERFQYGNVPSSRMLRTVLPEIKDLLESHLFPVRSKQSLSQEIHKQPIGNEMDHILKNLKETFTLQTHRRVLMATEKQYFEQVVDGIIRNGTCTDPQDVSTTAPVAAQISVRRCSLKSTAKEKYEKASHCLMKSNVKLNCYAENSYLRTRTTRGVGSKKMDTGEGNDDREEGAVDSPFGARVTSTNSTLREEENRMMVSTGEQLLGKDNDEYAVGAVEKTWWFKELFFIGCFISFLISCYYIYVHI